MTVLETQQKVIIYADLADALDFIRTQEGPNPRTSSVDEEWAKQWVATHDRRPGLARHNGPRIFEDPEKVFDQVSPHFQITFDHKTVLRSLVAHVASNAPGFPERDPDKMVALIARYVDYPAEKIAHRVALVLAAYQDPHFRRVGGVAWGFMEGHLSFRGGVLTPLATPRSDERFAEESARFRFCVQHLEDVEKRSQSWREAVAGKLLDLRDVHFDHGNEHALTIEEVVAELQEIREIYGHRKDMDRSLVRFVADADEMDRELIVSLLEPLKVSGLISNRPGAGEAAAADLDGAQTFGRTTLGG